MMKKRRESEHRIEQATYMFSCLERAMVREINANAHKGGWTEQGRKHHAREVEYHAAKLSAAITTRAPDERIVEYAADVANCAWMAMDDLILHVNLAIARRKNEPDYVRPSVRFWLAMPYRYRVKGLIMRWRKRVKR